jgi:AcrR family transcriptional regulator
VIPLLAEHGRDVSTRQIAQAAGVAEGTIFRVFPDKVALLMAAAHEAINPADSAAQWEQAIAGVDDLRAKVRIAADRVIARVHLAMPVMLAVRSHFLAGAHAERLKHAPAGPPAFVVEAQTVLLQQLTTMFEPHRDELAVDPEIAALALRSLIFGSSRAAFDPGSALTPDQIADLVLDGTLRKDT